MISTLLFFFLSVPLNVVRAIDLEETSFQSSTTNVSGLISANTVWKIFESPYIATGNVIVGTDVTLTIEAGVVVKFAGYFYLMVEGILNVAGSQLAPVLFTSNYSSPSPDDWRGIESSGFNSVLAFNYTRIQYASNGIYCNNGNVTIANSEIAFNNVGIYYFQHSHSNLTQGNINDNIIRSNNVGIQIDIYDGPIGNLELENNEITSNSEGVKLNFFNNEGFNASIRRNVISLNDGSGVEIDGGAPGTSSVDITQNYVTFNGLHGISLDLQKKEARDVFSITDNDLHDNKAYDFRLGGQYISNIDYTVNASRNYWGTTYTPSIDEKIHDFYDDHKLGKVSYIPVLDFPLEARHSGLAIDRTGPIVSISSRLDNTFTGSSNVSITWNGFDAGSGIDHYVVKLDYDQDVNVEVTTDYLFENTSEGAHIVSVFAFDNAGNIGEVQVNFGVDLTSPVISDFSTVNSSEIKVSMLNLSWSGSDAISGIDHYEIKLDSDVWINLAGQTNYTFTYLPDGRHKITVKALDRAQNSRETSLSLVVNTSFLFGPGWIDDAAFFGGISILVII